MVNDFITQIDPHTKKRHLKIPSGFTELFGKNDPTTHGHKVPDLKEADLKVTLDNICSFTEKVCRPTPKYCTDFVCLPM